MELDTIEPAQKIDARHFRMARAGVNLSIRELAKLTGLNKATIVRLEAGLNVRNSSVQAVRDILEAKGATFWHIKARNQVVISVDID